MICGIGCDIVEVRRFEKWVKNPAMIERYFNESERCEAAANFQKSCEHYAVRFAAKESFSKALGTGINGFELTDIYIKKDEAGRPSLSVTGRALEKMDALFGKGCTVHISLSHEKEYSIAFVVIERG